MRVQLLDIAKGLAILAVVFIHSSGYLSVSDQGTLEWYTGVISRQFVNFAVPVFLFISGFLSFSSDVHDTVSFLKKKVLRIITPYLFWSFAYFCILFPTNNYNFDIKNIIAQLVLGTGIGVGYFVIVLMQFVILTPLINKIASIKTHLLVIGGLTVIAGLFNYMTISSQHLSLFSQFPYSAILFIVWYPYYHMGFLFKKFDITRPKYCSNYLLFFVMSLSLFLAVFEGMHWAYSGNYTFAVSQLKITSMILSLCVCIFICFNIKSSVDNHFLSRLGTVSYGIYLTHMLFVWLYHHLLSHTIIFSKDLILLCGVVFILSFTSSVTLVFLIKKCSGKYSAYIVG